MHRQDAFTQRLMRNASSHFEVVALCDIVLIVSTIIDNDLLQHVQPLMHVEDALQECSTTIMDDVRECRSKLTLAQQRIVLNSSTVLHRHCNKTEKAYCWQVLPDARARRRAEAVLKLFSCN